MGPPHSSGVTTTDTQYYLKVTKEELLYIRNRVSNFDELNKKARAILDRIAAPQTREWPSPNKEDQDVDTHST